MRKLLLSSVVFTALAVGPALAADMPRKAPAYQPPPLPPPISWTGFYVGLNAGGTWLQNVDVDNTVSPGAFDAGFPHGNNQAITDAHLAAISAATTGTLNDRGGNNNGAFIGGVQVGYNWQLGGWVAGIEADFQGIAKLNGDDNNNFNLNGGFVNVVPVGIAGEGSYVGAAAVRNTEIDWFGTVRGRIGWLASPDALLYATGGLAYGRATGNIAVGVFNNTIPGHGPDISGSTFISRNDTNFGWTAGAGFEWMFMPKWSVKGEYLYFDLGSLEVDYPLTVRDNASGLIATFNGKTSFDVTGHIVRLGINWHF